MSEKHTQFDGFIKLQELTVAVIVVNNVEYVAAKPLSDFAGVNWRSAKKAFLSEENTLLYGSEWLNPPVIGGLGGASTPSKEVLFIKLDQAYLYFARINTSQMKAQGNLSGGERLMRLQQEWGVALRNYEVHGKAVKDSHIDNRRKNLKELTDLINTRKNTLDDKEKSALTILIHAQLTKLGVSIGDVDAAQGELAL